MTAPTEVDCSRLFAPLGLRSRTAAEVRVAVNEYSYLPPGEMDEGWLPNVRAAFTALGRARRCDTFCSIGCGPGVDAILAAELINPRSMILTDLRDDVVELARENVLRNCTSLDAGRLLGLTGSLCDELIARGLSADVIYENLPNLPTSTLNLASGCRTASFFDPGQSRPVPAEFADNMLALHYLFLSQVRNCLSADGVVVCSIGLRVPLDLVLRLFEINRFRSEILAVGAVRQLAAEEVLPHYADIEAASPNRTPFLFFPHAALVEAVRKSDRPDVSRRDLIAAVAGRADLALSAQEAYHAVRFGDGAHVGHLGAVILGTPM